MGIRTASEVLTKAPDEIVIRFVEFSAAGLADDETIAAILDASVLPDGDLAIDEQGYDGTRVQLTLSGGEAGATYTIHVQVQTSEGQTPEACCIMRVLPC